MANRCTAGAAAIRSQQSADEAAIRMTTRDRSRARPIIRVLAGILVVAALFASFLAGRGVVVEADAKSAVFVWFELLFAFAMGHVALTGRWPWRLADEAAHDRSA
jgi:hypothetical protein